MGDDLMVMSDAVSNFAHCANFGLKAS